MVNCIFIYVITIKNTVDATVALKGKEEINAKYTKSRALLKAVRLREGLNQKDFAEIINVTQGDLSKMERGKRPIGKNLALRILKKFGSRIIG